mgnify:CR=1 FL=1
MSDVNENKFAKVKLIKHFIKDLSFENPQDINDNNAKNNNSNNLDIKMNVVHQTYKDNFFSLILKYSFDCSSKKNSAKLFNLELDYFGFFKILEDPNNDKKSTTEEGLKLIYPFAKNIIEDLTQKGGSVPISLNSEDFILKNN